jgi:hypothetical protein
MDGWTMDSSAGLGGRRRAEGLIVDVGECVCSCGLAVIEVHFRTFPGIGGGPERCGQPQNTTARYVSLHIYCM